MSDVINLYISAGKLPVSDDKKPKKTEWLYTVPQNILTRLSQYPKWNVTCDYVSMSSNISTVEGCTIGFYNNMTKSEYYYDFPPSVDTDANDIQTRIQTVCDYPEVSAICGIGSTRGKIFSFQFNSDTNKFEFGKATGTNARIPAITLHNKLFVIFSKKLATKIGFSRDQTTLTYAEIHENDIVAEDFPDFMKDLRRLYLTVDCLKPSYLNVSLYNILCDFNYPYFFNTETIRGDYGFTDSVEIDRSKYNHWVPMNGTLLPIWTIGLINENGEILTVFDRHTLQMRLRIRPAGIED